MTLVLSFFFNPPLPIIIMLKRFRKMRAHHKIIFAFLIGFAVISFWRGIWGILDIHLFPGNRELSLWSSVLIGMLILVITNYATKELV